MKAIKAFFAIAFALTITSTAKAQNYKLDGPFLTTKSIEANGVCEMCKHRIENALRKSPTITSAIWNEDSKTVQVQHYRAQINPDKIQQLIAAVGHDTKKIKASDEAYASLPNCCHYPRKL